MKKTNKQKKKHAPLQDSVRGYIREISVAMFLQIQKDIFHMYIFNSLYLLHSYNPSFLICLCLNMVSFRGQKKLGPRPDRSLLGD